MAQQAARPRPLRADAARNRRALLDAAHEAFLRDGCSASLDDIARAAGVGPGTLYRHFPTRDELVLAVIDDGLIAVADTAETVVEERDSLQALVDWLDRFIAQAGLFDGLARTLVGTRPPVGQTEGCRRTYAAGVALVGRAVTAGTLRADVTADDVLDLAAAIAWLDSEPQRRRRLLLLLVDGLRPGVAG